MLSSLDVSLFHWIAGNASSPSLLIYFAKVCAKVFIYVIPLYLILFWLYGGNSGRKTVVTILGAVGVALFVSFLIGHFYYRPRPFIAGVGAALADHRANASFPSNHAIIFATYVTVLFMRHYKTAAYIGLVAGLFTCWARVFVGVHYPLDIVGGIVFGILVGFVVVRFVVPFIPNALLKIVYNLPPRSRNLNQ